MTRKLAAVAALLTLAGCGSEPDRPVGPDPAPGGTNGAATAPVFADSALQSAVAEAAAAVGSARDLVSLSAKDRGIADLDGIEQLARLEVLDLYGNEIRDLSPLEGLRRLRYLDLGSNRVEEVTALASLKSLQVLLLADNGVTDLAALAGLDSLQSVDLTGNEVTDVSALAGLDSLRSVDLTGNPLSGPAVEAQVAALRERGVSVEFEAPEPEDTVEVVAPEGPVPPLGDSHILFSSNRRLKGSYLSSREVHSLDLETGEVVNLCSVLAAVPFSDGSVPDSLERHYVSRTSEDPAGSPDGTRVAFSSFRDGNKEIYVMDADGGHPVNLTRHDAFDSSPAWSPDGRRIAFESNRDGGMDHIFVMNADGSGVEQLTHEFQAPWAFSPSWSPDGSSIACVSAQDIDLWGIHSLELGSRALHLISLAGLRGTRPSWSPDGARIAYAVADTANDFSHVWVMAADGSGARQLTFAESWDSNPTWSPDGTRIAFARQTEQEIRYDIFIVPAEGGAAERVTADPHDDMDPSWTPF